MRKLAKRIWQQAQPIAAGDAVATYLSRRGIVLAEYPKVLRTHPALGFYVKEAGRDASQARTDLPGDGGSGARAGRPCRHAAPHLPGAGREGADRRVQEAAQCGGISGAAVRLFEPTDELAVAEGIETALAVHVRTGKPVWAALQATNMEKLWIPAQRETRSASTPTTTRATPARPQPTRWRSASRPQAKERGPREVAVYVPRRGRYRLGGCAARTVSAGGMKSWGASFGRARFSVPLRERGGRAKRFL